MAARSHVHLEGGLTCAYPTKRECDDAYADWQADQQVLLAARIVAGGRGERFRKDSTAFGQLVQVLDGRRETITNGDGVEASAPFTRRLLAALERHRRLSTG